MSEDLILESVLQRLREDGHKALVGSVDPQALRLEEDLGLDSMDVLELLMELEEEHGIDIPEELTEDVETVGDLARVVWLLVAKQKANL
jgi:acyl carrier protein